MITVVNILQHSQANKLCFQIIHYVAHNTTTKTYQCAFSPVAWDVFQFQFVSTCSTHSSTQLFLSVIFLNLFHNNTLIPTNTHTHISQPHFICVQDSKLNLVKLAIFIPLKTNQSHSDVSCRIPIDISNAQLRVLERKGNAGKVRLRCLRNNLKLFI